MLYFYFSKHKKTLRFCLLKNKSRIMLSISIYSEKKIEFSGVS